MTLTKEWLLKTIAELENERDAIPGAVNEDAAMALAAMKLALASLTAPERESVEFLPNNLDRALTILGVALPISKEEFNLDAERWMQRLIDRVIGLESELTPPAPVMPEEMTGGIALTKYRIKGSNYKQWTLGWNACRAAMLQGAAGNSPAIPNGYALVPVEPTPEMLAEIRLVDGWTERALQARYKAMLAAAPQQEVK